MAVNFYTVIGKHPSIGFKKTNKVTVDRAQFGDGYVQRTVSGLNTTQQDYQVSFRNQDLATAQKIIDFLSTAGTKDFGTGAAATAVLSGGAISSFTMTDYGSNYYIVPTVTITGDGTGAVAHAVINTSGQVTSIVVDTAGSSYTTATVTITPAAGDRSRAGVDYFYWTPTDSTETIKVTCEEWDEEYSSTISRTINAKFVRVYDI